MRALALMAGLSLLALPACGDEADPDTATPSPTAKTEATATAPAPVAAGGDEAVVVPRAELGSLRPEHVVRALAWTTERLDRGERRAQAVSQEAAPPPEPTSVAVLDEVRVARGDGYDRVVFELAGEGALPAYHLSYVSAPLSDCGSGQPIRPGGEGWLFVQLLDTRAHDETGESTIIRDVRAPGFPNLKELHLLCDSGETVEWVLALTESRPFRVIEARTPGRLVVDVQH